MLQNPQHGSISRGFRITRWSHTVVCLCPQFGGCRKETGLADGESARCPTLPLLRWHRGERRHQRHCPPRSPLVSARRAFIILAGILHLPSAPVGCQTAGGSRQPSAISDQLKTPSGCIAWHVVKHGDVIVCAQPLAYARGSVRRRFGAANVRERMRNYL